MILRNDLPVEKIRDDVYLINEFDGTNCYLVVGEKKAMLIDCGTGFCDLKTAVKRITDKPLFVVATHGHCDHIGGAGQFGRIYVHSSDCKKLNKIQTTVAMRKLFVMSNSVIRKNGFSANDIEKGEFEPEFIEINDGDIFDLGGKTITVKHTPGHTVGSIALIDEEDKIIFSGDNVCDALWMMLPGATSIEEWLPSAKWLYSKSNEYEIYWGHRTPKLSRDYIADVISWGEDILLAYESNERFSKIVQFPRKSDGIIFRTGNIYKK